MKKSIIVALFCILGLAQMNAQVSFKPGIRGGLNISHFSQGDYTTYFDGNGNPISGNNLKFGSKTDFYLGVFGALKLTKYYTLQPEINYSRQGAKSPNSNNNLDVDYLSFSVINKFAFTNKFNIHLGTTIDFIVQNNFSTDSDLDLAFVLGTEYNITPNFSLEARVKKGIVPVLYSSGDHSNVVFSFGGTYKFDLK